MTNEQQQQDTTTQQCPFDTATDDFDLVALTAEMLETPLAVSKLYGLSRCKQLAVLLNMSFKGASIESVAALNEALLYKWGEVRNA